MAVPGKLLYTLLYRLYVLCIGWHRAPGRIEHLTTAYTAAPFVRELLLLLLLLLPVFPPKRALCFVQFFMLRIYIYRYRCAATHGLKRPSISVCPCLSLLCVSLCLRLDKIDSPQYLQTALGVVMLAVSKKDDHFQTLVSAMTGDCCLREAFDVVWDWAANHSDPALVLVHLLQEARTATPERRAVLLRQLDRPDEDTSTDGRFLGVLVRALARELRGGLEVQQLPYGARSKAADAPGTGMPLGAPPGLDKSWQCCGAESRVSDASTVPDDNPTIMAKVRLGI